MEFFIANAWADGAGGPPPGAEMMNIVMLIVIGLIFWFMLIRPQQKRMKEHKALVEGLKKGDEVVTSGGILGKILAVDDTFISIEVADNTTLKVQKSHVGAVMPKGTIKSA